MTREFTYWPGDALSAKPKHAAKPVPLRSLVRSWLRHRSEVCTEEEIYIRVVGAAYRAPRPTPARRSAVRRELLRLVEEMAWAVCAFAGLWAAGAIYLHAKGIA